MASFIPLRSQKKVFFFFFKLFFFLQKVIVKESGRCNEVGNYFAPHYFPSQHKKENKQMSHGENPEGNNRVKK